MIDPTHTADTEDAQHETTRRQFLGAEGTGLAMSSVPMVSLRFSTDDRLTPLAQAFVQNQGRVRNPLSAFDADIREYGGQPSWYLKLDDNDDLEALEDWADGEQQRRIIRTSHEPPTATIATSVTHL